MAGLPVDFLNGLLAALTAVAIVAAMRVVGVLLVAALMVLPVASAQLLAHSFRATVRIAALIGVASAVVGLAVARQAGLPPGGTVVLVAAAAFAVLSVAGPGSSAFSSRARPGLPGWDRDGRRR